MSLNPRVPSPGGIFTHLAPYFPSLLLSCHNVDPFLSVFFSASRGRFTLMSVFRACNMLPSLLDTSFGLEIYILNNPAGYKFREEQLVIFVAIEQTWVNYEFPFRNLFPSTPFKLLPNFRRTNMHTESLAVIQKQWREKNLNWNS